MAYRNLNEFIQKLREEGELIEIQTPVSPNLEITEITDRISKSPQGGKAILFWNNGTSFPVLMNMFGSEKRICLALGIEKLDDLKDRIELLIEIMSKPLPGFWNKLKMLPKLADISRWFPRKIKGRGACQEIVMEQVDLSKFPILKCWPLDGGRFITFPLVHTLDPNTGIRNLGMYRMQEFSRNTSGMHWHLHKTGAKHYEAYKRKGELMPVAVALGGDPVYTYCATAPLPDHIDEYILAGFIRKKPVQLVKCLTQEIYVPEDCDIVLEGYVDPKEEKVIEGPFGDHTGFYSLEDLYPVFHITCITYRKNAIYPATIVGIPPMEDAYLAKATERIFLAPIKKALLPEVIDMTLPYQGVAHNIAIIQIHKEYAGHATKVANALWGAGQMMFNKIMIIIDQFSDISNLEKLAFQIVQNLNFPQDIYLSKGPLDVLDHASSSFAFGSKICFDATQKLENEISTDTEWPFPELQQNPSDSSIQNQIQIELDKALIQIGFPIAIIKANFHHSKLDQKIIKDLLQENSINQIKILIFVDREASTNIDDLIWLVSGNIDPQRDCRHFLWQGKSVLCIDASRKTKEKDFYMRRWPNILVMNQETIQRIDGIWKNLNLGEWIESPSKSHLPFFKGNQAFVSNPDVS